MARFEWWACCLFSATIHPTVGHAATIAVAAGGDLQAALVNAQPGDTILLEAGAAFVGNFTLPQKGDAAFITVRTDGADAVPDGTRMTPGAAARLAKLRSPNGAPALQTAPGTHHWRLELLEIQGSVAAGRDLITLGDGSAAQATLSAVPHDLVIDRCYIHGDANQGQKRCVALNSAATTISNSYIGDCKASGQDSQAIAGWNGPGPFTITNNYVEGAGENILFGGADPAIPSLVPSEITITGNTVAKPVVWRTESWQVKNLLELKNARNVRVERNTFAYNWQAAQVGYAILFTVRNQDGHCPWCVVSDVTFDGNVVEHSAGGMSILGTDDTHPSQQTHAIQITNNVFADIDDQHWGGNGYFLMLTGGPRDITVDHNTIIQDHASGLIQLDGPPIPGFRFTNNLGRQNAYGVIGTNRAPGNDSIHAFLPGAQFTANVIADGNPSNYPPGNQFATSDQFKAQFASYRTGDYSLVTRSRWRGAGTDKRDLGANLAGFPRIPPDPPVRPQKERAR